MVRDNDLIVPRKRLGKRLRVHDGVKVRESSEICDRGRLMGLR